MEKNYDDENTVRLQEPREEENEDDETLSLSDLPLTHTKEEKEENTNRVPQAQQDFDFCALSTESEMRAADEIFFQGQIMPLRDSLSSENGSLLQYCKTRSESMDHLCSGSGGLISSRSSSIGSYQSSNSSGRWTGHKSIPTRNQFHSHPSPSPRIHLPGSAWNANNRNNCPKKPSAWSAWNVFRLGIITAPPEIAFQDLKPRNRSSNGVNFGSRNSTDSNSSSIRSSEKLKRKKKSINLLGVCKFSLDAVDTVRPRIVVIKRSDVETLQLEQENTVALKPDKKNQASKKKHSTHRRTFEWLKELSLEDA